MLQHELAVRELGQKITTDTRERISKSQREYFLREQLRSIQQELGESEEGGDVGDLRKRLDEARLPEEARREAERELGRLGNVPPASPEHGIIRTYLDWMASLPWSVLTGGEIDVKHAHEVLDEDHYDLEKVKDRILEYLAVKKLREERAALASEVQDAAAEAEVPGPNAPRRGRVELRRRPRTRWPASRSSASSARGVGKTSLGQSIARRWGEVRPPLAGRRPRRG